MAVSRSAPNANVLDAQTGGDAGWYSLFGRYVLSELRLPMASLDGQPAPGIEPSWTFERARPGQAAPPIEGVTVSEIYCSAPCHKGKLVSRVQRGATGSWLWHDSVGTFYVTPDARRVTVYPESHADPGYIQMFLLGQVSALVLHQQGYPSLHSSAVQTTRGAVVFLGPRGQGKSTMAASFLRHGSTLITDDVLPLRIQAARVYCGPGVSIMKLWGSAAEHTLHLAEELPTFLPNCDKKLLTLDGRYALADEAQPVRAIYVLDRFERQTRPGLGVSVTRLTPREAHGALIAQTSWAELLLPAERARLLPLYAKLVAQAPVRLLRYPSDFAMQDEVRATILADLEQA